MASRSAAAVHRSYAIRGGFTAVAGKRPGSVALMRSPSPWCVSAGRGQTPEAQVSGAGVSLEVAVLRVRQVVPVCPCVTLPHHP
jgi:hypothetical protein